MMDGSLPWRWDFKLITKPKQFLFCFIILLGIGGSASADTLLHIDQALKKIYPQATAFEHQRFTLDDEQVSLIEEKARINFEPGHMRTVKQFTVKQSDQVVGYAYEDVVVGKWGPIHYVVGLDSNGKVVRTIVLDYQEIRGKPIAKKRFLRQYKGKTVKNPVRLRRDIDGITGATISSTSFTNGIRKILHFHQMLLN
jgi:Na+-translocating ferredoxin:NAD+ oxidoreductase RnfG subunit